MLYRRGWGGLVIDPNVSLKVLFKIFRPRDIFVHAGVGEGQRRYEMFADGAYNKFAEGEGIKLQPLKDILNEHSISHIDFLNVDVEGMDLEVLKTHDWAVRPRVIAVESDFDVENMDKNSVYTFLRHKEYRLAGVAGKTLIFTMQS
jgi:hypothetical protein